MFVVAEELLRHRIMAGFRLTDNKWREKTEWFNRHTDNESSFNWDLSMSCQYNKKANNKVVRQSKDKFQGFWTGGNTSVYTSPNEKKSGTSALCGWGAPRKIVGMRGDRRSDSSTNKDTLSIATMITEAGGYKAMARTNSKAQCDVC